MATGAAEGGPAAPSPPQQNDAAEMLAAVPSLDVLLSCSDSVFAAMDKQGKLMYVSPTLTRVLNLMPSEALGRFDMDMVHPDDREKYESAFRSVLAAPARAPPAHVDVRLADVRLPDGSFMRVHVELCTDGEYVLSTARDASRERRTEEMLRSFLLVTSHDLRTPVHSMQCASQLLASRPDVSADSEAIYLLNVVRASASLMLTTIENVLEMKRLEEPASMGRLAGLQKRERVRPRAVFGSVLEVCRVACSKDIRYTNEAEDIPELEGDGDRLQQVLQNAALACVRYGTPQTECTAELRCQEIAPGIWLLRAVFMGPGRVLSEAELRCAFDPSEGAMGLALLVARSSARTMGGDLVLSSDARGSRLDVSVRLFTPGAHVATEEGAAPSPRSGMLPPSAAPAAKDAPQLFSQMAQPTSPKAAATPLGAVDAPPPTAEDFAARLFKHLTQISDEIFKCAQFSEDGQRLTYVYVSPNITRLYGWTPQQLVGRAFEEFSHPDDVAHMKEELMRARTTCGIEPCGFTHRFRLPDGTYTWLSSSGCTHDGYLYAMCKDSREQMEKEEALRKLLLCISRELREPANSVLAAKALLAQRASVSDDAEAAFWVQAIGASCRLLLGIVTNVLSMRVIESGELEMLPVEYDPSSAVNDVLQVCRLGCSSRVEWRNEDEPLPRIVLADRTFFCQILQNLVTNAVKFEGGLGVTVTVSCRTGVETPAGASAAPPPPGVTHTLVATVADRGRGLTAEEQQRIFQAYAAASAMRGGGTGLGLYISRAYARRAGGDVTVQSEPGKGATFALRLPVRVEPGVAAEWEAARARRETHEHSGAVSSLPPSSPPLTALSAPPDVLQSLESDIAPPKNGTDITTQLQTPAPAGRKRQREGVQRAEQRLRCLVADDHALNLKLLERLLQQRKFEVQTACDGGDAYAKLVAAYESGTPPHIALIDMQMPVMSGPDATRAFRAWEQQHRPGQPRLPVVCITANVLEQHQQECEAAGMDMFVTKPLRANTLAQLEQLAASYAEQLEQTPGGGEALPEEE